MEDLTVHIDQIKRICSLNKVKTLFAFGSVLTDKYKADSDLDLIVDFNESDPISYTDSYFKLKEQLEQLLKRKIDLLEQKAIRNPYLNEQIDTTKVLIYGD